MCLTPTLLYFQSFDSLSPPPRAQLQILLGGQIRCKVEEAFLFSNLVLNSSAIVRQ